MAHMTAITKLCLGQKQAKRDNIQRIRVSANRSWQKSLFLFGKFWLIMTILGVESYTACTTSTQSYGGWLWIVHSEALLPVLGYCHITVLRKARNTNNFNKVHPRTGISAFAICLETFYGMSIQIDVKMFIGLIAI